MGPHHLQRKLPARNVRSERCGYLRFYKQFAQVLGTRDFLVRIRIRTKNCPQSEKLNFLLKFCVKNFILQSLFQSARHIDEKREGSGSVPLTSGSVSGSGKPKNMRILRIRIRFRIPNTGLHQSLFKLSYFPLTTCALCSKTGVSLQRSAASRGHNCCSRDQPPVVGNISSVFGSGSSM